MSATVSSCIVDLLREHNCVIVPGLGAFVGSRVGARYDEQRGLMLPPTKEVVFNSEIDHADGMLADAYARANGVSYAEAEGDLSSFVAEAHRQLEAGSPVVMADFGTLLPLPGGNVGFEPVSTLNLLTESYGMSAVSAERVRRRQPLISGKQVRQAVGYAAAIGALLLVSPTMNDTDYMRADLSSAFASLSSPTAALEYVDAEVAESQESEADIADAADDRYCIVVASFATAREANEFFEASKNRGISGLEVMDYGGRQRVVAASFATQAEAVKANGEVRTVAGFGRAWVLHVVR